jgi:pyruvate/2-oxoglutarate dehydrogenase complex dihydrolipoamide acyltransferase (E2) component
MGVSVAEGTVVQWCKQVGDAIAAEETICEISTDKIDTELPAPVGGTVAEILVDVDTTVGVGSILARIAPDVDSAEAGGAGDGAPLHGASADGAIVDGTSKAAGPPQGSSSPATAGPANGSGTSRRRYSPVVQRIASEHRIDLNQVPGTGRGGRVRKQDVLALVESRAGSESDQPLHIESPYRPELSPSPDSPEAAPAQLSRIRRQIGEHMKRSLDTAAHCTTWIEVDMTRVEAARARLGLTALPIVASGAIAALREHPALNAWLEGDRYTQHEDVNLGIAVSLGETGLIVPVIHQAQMLSAEGLAVRIKDLARRARGGELQPDEVRGGTFTITNPGQYGSIMATPIINQPQVAILDLEAVVKRPLVVTDADGNDSIAIRPITILGLSWDHRALDGALAAQFLATLKRGLEGLSGA